MDKVIYKTEIKVWGSDDRESVTIVTEPEGVHSMMHTLTAEEWSVIEMILEALASPQNPVPYILREFGHLGPADDRSVANVYKEEDAKLIALVPKMVEACVTTFSAHVEPRVDWRALKHETAMEKIIAVIKELEKE